MSKEKFEKILDKIRTLNRKKDWKLEKLKLWRGKGFPKKNQAWGFTKIKNKKGRELVFESLKEISQNFPETTWVVFDEGKKKQIRLVLKNGKFLFSF